MICPKCSAYFVRYPCPECGFKPEEVREEKEETTVRPSQLHGRSVFSPEEMEEIEHNVSPSAILKRQREESEEIPSFQRFEKDLSSETGGRQLSPMQRQEREKEAKEEEIPSFMKYEQEHEDDEHDMNEDMKTIASHIGKSGNHDKLKNDVKYRKKVKSTLQEVMDLLEKLIDE